MKCERCGEELFGDEDYCPECGSPVSEEAWKEANEREYEDVEVVEVDEIDEYIDYDVYDTGLGDVVEGSKDDDSGSQGFHESYGDWV